MEWPSAYHDNTKHTALEQTRLFWPRGWWQDFVLSGLTMFQSAVTFGFILRVRPWIASTSSTFVYIFEDDSIFSDAIFESDCIRIAGTNTALLYKNVKPRLLQSSDEASLFILKVIIMQNKGKRKQNVSWMFTQRNFVFTVNRISKGKSSFCMRIRFVLQCVSFFISWSSSLFTMFFILESSLLT